MDDTGAAMFSELLTAMRGDGAVGTTALECKLMAPAVLADIQQVLLLCVMSAVAAFPQLRSCRFCREQPVYLQEVL